MGRLFQFILNLLSYIGSKLGLSKQKVAQDSSQIEKSEQKISESVQKKLLSLIHRRNTKKEVLKEKRLKLVDWIQVGEQICAQKLQEIQKINGRLKELGDQLTLATYKSGPVGNRSSNFFETGFQMLQDALTGTDRHQLRIEEERISQWIVLEKARLVTLETTFDRKIANNNKKISEKREEIEALEKKLRQLNPSSKSQELSGESGAAQVTQPCASSDS